MKIKRGCPFCSNVTEFVVDDKNYNMYQSGMSIAEAFPDLDAFSREVLISGMCFSCQEKTFNKPTKEHADEWGDVIGECENCGCELYSKHNLIKGTDNKYKCPACWSTSVLIDGSLVWEDEDEDPPFN